MQTSGSSQHCICCKMISVCSVYRSKRRSIGDDLLSADSKAIKMGNAELTRLWNLCPDNMAACLSEKRC